MVTRRTIARRSRKSAHGGFGAPSKMPGLAYGIAATECNVGSKLRNVENSTCADCYALKGRYTIPAGTKGGSVAAAHQRRLQAFRDDPIAWQVSIVRDLRAATADTPPEQRFFRWHDSGDLQDATHLLAIVTIARACPEWRFWLPTREYALARRLIKSGDLPDNLVVRVSDAMVNGKPPKFATHSSGVYSAKRPYAGTADKPTCPAYKQGGVCGDCRLCWNPDVARVIYPLH